MEHIGFFYDRAERIETQEFLDDVLEYFQENNCERAEEFEEWKEKRDSAVGSKSSKRRMGT